MLSHLVFLLSFLPFSYAQCQSGYYLDPAANKCFKVYTQSLNYFGAWKTCDLDGGSLASIPNAFVNSFIGGLLSSETSYYIGLNKLSSDSWAWLDGSTVSYSNWNTGSGVTNNCTSIQSITNKWIDQACQDAFPFICSTPALQGQGLPTTTCAPQKPPPTCAVPQNVTRKPICDDGWTFFSNTSYCYSTITGSGINYFDAEKACVAVGVHLVSIHSSEENDFVAQISATGMNLDVPNVTWIGFTRYLGDWTWTDGTPVDYIHSWGPNGNGGKPWPEPSDCTYIFSDDCTCNATWKLTWNNEPCTNLERSFVCKKLPNQ